MRSKTSWDSLPANRRTTTVWLVDAHKIYRSVLADRLNQQGGVNCARQFPSVEATFAALAVETAPDVILLDWNSGGRNGIGVVRAFARLAPATRVAMLTPVYDPAAEVAALSAGASGFLWKGCPFSEILDAIRSHEPPRRPGEDVKIIRLDRQERAVAGSLVVIGVLLGLFAHRGFFGVPAFVGAGLVLGGITDFCGAGRWLTKLPWNRRRPYGRDSQWQIANSR